MPEPRSRNWPSQALLQQDVFKAAGTTPGTRPNALALANNAYLRAEAIWKTWGSSNSSLDITFLILKLF